MHAEKNNSEPFAKPPLRGLPGIAFPTFAHHGSELYLKKYKKNSCNVREFPIEYQVLWHDSYEARGCYPLW